MSRNRDMRRWRHRASLQTLSCATSLLLLLSACEHPLGVFTPHIEAADLVVSDSAGELLTRTEFNRSWMVDSLLLRDGEALRVLLTPIDFQGKPLDLSSRSDLSYRMEAENAALLQWEPQRGFGWLRPFAPGTTRIRFLIWHDTHADFVTPWLRVVVNQPVAAPKTVQEIQHVDFR